MKAAKTTTAEEGLPQLPPQANPPPPHKTAEPPPTILGRLFRMAEGYHQRKETNQAIEMYFELVERNAGTQEGRMARERLMQICDDYEREGKVRQARALYERLL